MDTKGCLTSHIWRVGAASNNPQIAAWGAWIPDNKTVSERMIDRITEENIWNRRDRWGESINSYWISPGSGKSILEEILNIYVVKHKKKKRKITRK